MEIQYIKIRFINFQVSANVRFKYEIIMRLKKLEVLDEDHLKELDREIAEQFYIQNKSIFIDYLLIISYSTIPKFRHH